uniref:PAS2 n=1 Tax=Arundo donax TaxID=35708 RepID=A0A0A9G6N9_ARUDO
MKKKTNKEKKRGCMCYPSAVRMKFACHMVGFSKGGGWLAAITADDDSSLMHLIHAHK